MRMFKRGAGILAMALVVAVTAYGVTTYRAGIDPMADQQTALPLARI